LGVASGSASGAEPTARSDERTLRGVGRSGPEAPRRERWIFASQVAALRPLRH